MDGERDPQPGNRPAAPGGLAVVQRFLNTHYDLAGHHGELLDTPAALRRWMAECRLVDPDATVGETELLRMINVREGLRHLAIANNGGQPDMNALRALDDASHGALIAGPSGRQSELAQASAVMPWAVGLLVALDARAMLDGSWARLKGEYPGRRPPAGSAPTPREPRRPLVRDVGLRRPRQGPRLLPPRTPP